MTRDEESSLIYDATSLITLHNLANVYGLGDLHSCSGVICGVDARM
jgi:hypothetical protein